MITYKKFHQVPPEIANRLLDHLKWLALTGELPHGTVQAMHTLISEASDLHEQEKVARQVDDFLKKMARTANLERSPELWLTCGYIEPQDVLELPTVKLLGHRFEDPSRLYLLPKSECGLVISPSDLRDNTWTKSTVRLEISAPVPDPAGDRGLIIPPGVVKCVPHLDQASDVVLVEDIRGNTVAIGRERPLKNLREYIILQVPKLKVEA